MLELVSLNFKNIRCFDKQQSVCFTNRDKLIQIDGRNENTGGSSGAGKTTVFLALDYLLGVSDIPSTLLQSRLTKDSIEVSGIFNKDNTTITIRRSKKSGLSVQVGEESISGNVKIAEEKLDEIIGIPRKIFKKMIHKRQKDGGFFLDMTSKEIYGFLVSVLDLDKFIDQTEDISEDIKRDNKKLESINGEVKALHSNLATLESVLKDKIKPTNSVKKEDLVSLEESVSQYERIMLDTKTKESEELGKIIAPKRQSFPFNYSPMHETQAQKNDAKDKHGKIEQALLENNKKLVKIVSLKSKVQFMSEQVSAIKEQHQDIKHKASCPTCKREWTGEDAQFKMNTLQEESEVLVKSILSFKDDIGQEAEINKNIHRLSEMVKDCLGQRDHLNAILTGEKIKEEAHQVDQENKHNAKMANYYAILNEAKLKFEKPILDSRLKWEEAKDQYNSMSASYAHYNKNIAVYNSELSKIAEMINKNKADLLTLSVSETGLNKSIIIAEESKRLIKAYVLQTFQETLDLIGDTATDILSAIPNMNNSTIYFEGCKENKDGSLKDEVNAIINMDGINKVPIKSLSGGERTAIDLSVDLAVIDVIEVKTGKGANFFVIDEPFDGLDAVCKENCLEILKQLDTNKMIIMVDHSSELKEMVSDVITVVKNGESSSIIG